MTLLQQLEDAIHESIVRPDAPPQTVETGDIPAWQRAGCARTVAAR